MAVIPQFNAAGPAQSRSPVLEREQRNRIDNSSQINALGALAGSMARSNTPTPNVSPEFGQEGFQALQSVGGAIKQVGQVIFDIREKEADARNYNDIQVATREMENEAVKFARWKDENPDSRTWDSKWNEQFSGFQKTYFNNKELSPEAEEKIRQNMAGFGHAEAVRTAVSGIKRTTQQAQESVLANYYRHIDAGNADAAIADIQHGFDSGWIPEDDAVRYQIQARDAVESRRTDEAITSANYFALMGDMETARGSLEGAGIPEKEIHLQMKGLEAKYQVKQEVDQVDSMIFEKPGDAVEALSKKDKKGNYTQFTALSPAHRQAKTREAKQALNQFRADQYGPIVDRMREEGKFVPLTQFRGMVRELKLGLSPDEEKQLHGQLGEAIVKDVARTEGLFSDIATYNPDEDPEGDLADSLRRKIQWGSHPDHVEGLSELLDSRIAGEPPTLSDKAYKKFSDSLTELEKQGKFGRSVLNVADIEVIAKPSGEEVYAIKAPGLKPGEGGQFDIETGALWWKDKEAYRQIDLSQEDYAKLNDQFRNDANKRSGTVTDIWLQNKSRERISNIRKELDEAVKNGEVKTEQEADEFIRINSRVETDKMIDSIGSGLLPQASDRGFTLSGGLFHPDGGTDEKTGIKFKPGGVNPRAASDLLNSIYNNATSN